MVTRGIIISPTRTVSGREALDPVFLRQCALYWDKIDCPDDVMLSASLEHNRADVEVLESEGEFLRTRGYFLTKKSGGQWALNVHDEYPAQFWAVAQLYAFHKRNDGKDEWAITMPQGLLTSLHKETPDHFVFAESGPFEDGQQSNIIAAHKNALSALKAELHTGPSLQLELYSAVPVPGADVPIPQILRFKSQRQDELRRFRHALDGLYLEVTAAQDIQKAKSHAIEKVELALIDLSKVMEELGWRRLLRTLKVSLDLSGLIRGVLTATLVATSIGLPVLGAMVGLASLIKISVDPLATKPKEMPPNLRAYAYPYHAQRHFGGS